MNNISQPETYRDDLIFCDKTKIVLRYNDGLTKVLKNDLKKTNEYFLKFLFLFENTILPVNNGK